MTSNQKQTIRYTGICYTISDNTAIVESYGSNIITVLSKTLAGALCFGEARFTIVTTLNQRVVMLQHFTITDQNTGQYIVTGEEAL